MTMTSAAVSRTDSHNTNVPARARAIVKIKFLETNHYVVYAAGRAGIQYRKRRGIPDAVLNILRRDGVAFVFAYTARDGRWHLENVAPNQPW